MKKILIAALAALVSTSAFASSDDEDKGFGFVDKIKIKGTSVKDQHKSGTCWSFAGISFFENEILRASGEEIDLSEMFVVRHCYEDKADRYVRMYGNTTFSPGGAVLDIPYVIDRYGLVPDEAYSGLHYGEDMHYHFELDAILRDMVKNVVNKPNKRISTAWKKAYNAVLDAYLGEAPETFTYKGVSYTPQSFVEHLGISTDNYIAITSFSHHPFDQAFVLEVADNWLWAPYMNVPLADMKAILDNALANGYTAAWAADVSEGGFKWFDGVALMPKGKDSGDMDGTELSRWTKLSDEDRENSKYDFDGPVEEMEITQEERQRMFDAQETTDDHGMVIVGTAVDREGNKYYKVKNSWNTNQVYDGYIYVSEAYFLAKTLNIYVNKAAVPDDIARRIGLK